MRILEAMRSDDFEEVVLLQDRRCGLRAILAIHDTSSGPAFGGVRRWRYPREEHALRDVLRLARAMTLKCALAGIPGGGGKVVILDQDDLRAEEAYELLGRHVQQLGGRFYTGPDVGTGHRELSVLARSTEYVTRPDEAGPGDLASATAAGVIAGMRAALEELFGTSSARGLRFAIQGVGEVGAKIARLLVAEGAEISVADLDEGAIERLLAVQPEVEVLPPERLLDASVDVFCPCAMGGVIHDLSLGRLRARLVAGSANNILALPRHGEELHRRGIVYLPDYVLNAGALILGSAFHLRGVREVGAEIERIGETIRWILRTAREEGESPMSVADREAERRIAEARAKGRPFFPKQSTR
ncbi:MAG: Glu/Leu/Phe/Val dehydrogenase [Planctomycetes bacterium]|nr:Glu/Leu/Phe/Val dehydrogenase [Planctomycetota bacterium]